MRTVPHSSAESPGLGAIMVMVSSAMKRSCAEEPCWALTPLGTSQASFTADFVLFARLIQLR